MLREIRDEDPDEDQTIGVSGLFSNLFFGVRKIKSVIHGQRKVPRTSGC